MLTNVAQRDSYGPNELMWLMRFNNQLYGNRLNPTGPCGKVSREAVDAFVRDLRETLERLELLEDA